MLRWMCAQRASKTMSFFPLPCVMDAVSFTRLVRLRAAKLEHRLAQQIVNRYPGLQSQAFEKSAVVQARELCAPLAALRERDVEEIVFEKYGLKSQQAVTCLVPYQLAANIILGRLPRDIRVEAVAELKAEESMIRKHSGKRLLSAHANKWIGWYEGDLYVSDGIKYLKRIDSRQKKRVPIFAVMGHVNHGKTTLLDALQGSRVTQTEAHYITQTVRAFTTTHPTWRKELFTFLDVPGHKIFVEARYHMQRAADCILLVVSVVEGVESQTHETVKVALNLDKPIIVVLNKLDQLSDPFTAQARVRAVLKDLSAIGLDVCIVEKSFDGSGILDDHAPSVSASASVAQPHRGETEDRSSSIAGAAADARLMEHPAFSEAEACLLPMKQMDKTYKGSGWRPVLDLRRKCYGVCISAGRCINIPNLWSIMRKWRDTANPSCHSITTTWKEHNGAVQALVLESSKHLFDEEGFRQSRMRRSIQSEMDRAESRRASSRDKMSATSKMNVSMTSGHRQYSQANRTSTRSLVISVLVREGVVSRGMHFVADQAEGRVDYLIDYWGNSVDHAVPGMAVTIVDGRSFSGCPGPGIHVLSVTDEKTQLDIYHYRRMLQWYVELFTDKLHYLKPRGMDVRFAHLGDYGQLGANHTLEYQLLYGPPRQLGGGEGDGRRPPILFEGCDAQQQKSLGEYLAELNAADEAKVHAHGGTFVSGGDIALSHGRQPTILNRAVVRSPPCDRDALPCGVGVLSRPSAGSQPSVSPTGMKRVTQGLLGQVEEEALNHTWRSYQPTERLISLADYEQHVRQCVQIGVVLKVDNYHTARMLAREIPRLGTRKVAFQVVGVRFGPLTTEDVQFFANSTKVIVCYRTPYAPTAELDHIIEINDQWVLHTDHFADVLMFMKWCAVATHREYHANNGRMSDNRLYVPDKNEKSAVEGRDQRRLPAGNPSGLGSKDDYSEGAGKSESTPKGPTDALTEPAQRKQKLLLYSNEAD